MAAPQKIAYWILRTNTIDGNSDSTCYLELILSLKRSAKLVWSAGIAIRYTNERTLSRCTSKELFIIIIYLAWDQRYNEKTMLKNKKTKKK